MIPGANILALAQTVIAKQRFIYKAFQSKVVNSIGQDVPVYATPITLQGSVQPVARSLYQYMGLDFQKNYINVFVSHSVIDVGRDVSGDHIVFGGKEYQCLSITPWGSIDGWNQVLAVQVS